MGNKALAPPNDGSADSNSASTVIGSASPHSPASATPSAGSHPASPAVHPTSHSGLQATKATASQISGLNSQHIKQSGSNVAVNPPTVREAKQTVKHGVNSDYVIPKLQTEDFDRTQIGNIPFRSIPDKFGLRVCPQYNSKNGCHATLCRRFHVCLFWVKDQCKRNNCDHAHDFNSSHNELLMSIVSRYPRIAFGIHECLRNNHRGMRFKKQDSNNEICVFSVMNRCTKSDCPKTHAKIPYQWEVLIGSSWTTFSRSQTHYLEEMFSRPDNDKVKLPSLERNLRTHPAFSKFHSFLSKSKVWFVNFETMVLQSQHSSVNIRRLSTPSDIMVDISLATRWIWYWKDDSGCWHPYTDGAGEKFYIISLSDQMEYEKINARSQNMQVTIDDNPYSINLMDMYQQNKETSTIREIRRRPSCLPSKQKHDISFSDQFSVLSEGKTFLRHPIHETSSEYTHIKGLLQVGMRSIRIATMERIQNNHLWKAYQNKKKLLLSLYKNNSYLVNEQYMFHGTKHDVIDLICRDSFDWRLFGTNVGNVYGKGTYFTNDSKLSNSYSENKLGLKAVFVAFVLVGTLTKGNRDMEVPPQNSAFDRCFDTTCNDDFAPNIFVKYNKDEYYPAYIVKYHDAGCRY